MIIKVRMLYSFAIGVLLLLDINFFYLVDPPSIISGVNSMYCKALIAVVSVILGFCCLIFHNSYYKNYSFVKRYCLFVLIVSVLLIFHGWLTYNQSFSSLIRNCDFLLVVFLSLPVLYVMNDEKGYNAVMKLLNYFACIWYVLVIVQSLLYSASGTLFLNYYFDSSFLVRNGIRIFLMGIGNIMIFYNFHKIFESDSSGFSFIKYVIFFALGTYSAIFVQQTRSLNFALVIALLAMYLFESKNFFKALKHVVIIIAVVAFLQFSGTIESFINSFAAESVEGKSTLIREEAIDYYFQYWKKHPVFGMGLSTDELLIRGPEGTFYMSDVGFIGILAKVGIAAFILYGLLFVRWIYIIWKLMRSKNKKYRSIGAFLIGLLVFFTAPIYSISFFANSICINIPILLSIFEFWRHDYMCNGNINGGLENVTKTK